ncbi:hypothetical protein KFK09_014953 [Dendrobium nobile]|uniref:Protein FLUORESCENT IN BLUE LIGHT, chloroplastic n=1 Tax=Dendrobium nobile TaxID=94219 RepID=A0A8T3B9A2_DENNO|nr:hypothetical protein KFK09_014953 [Dendrobium nobile]
MLMKMEASHNWYQLSLTPSRGKASRLLLDASRRGVLSSQMMDFHVLRKEKMVKFFMGGFLSSKCGKIWLRPISINSKKDALQVSIMKSNERKLPFSFEQGLILANSLMLMLPFQALAETCGIGNSVLSMPVSFFVALIGAAVGGLLARKRKGELKRVNDQLRQINETLRRQAKIESHGPELSYAPVGRLTAKEVVDPRREKLISSLRTGKNYLRNQDFERAAADFKLALELAQSLGDHAEEKKAARGLGASLQRQGKFEDAMLYYSRVLAISKLEGEDSATTEAYGAIADCFTELGDLERAANYYDKYIERLVAN